MHKVCACACCSSAGCSTLIWFSYGFSLPRDTNLPDFSLWQKIKENTTVESIHYSFCFHFTYSKQIQPDRFFFFDLNVNQNDFNKIRGTVNGWVNLRTCYRDITHLRFHSKTPSGRFLRCSDVMTWGMEEGVTLTFQLFGCVWLKGGGQTLNTPAVATAWKCGSTI